MLKRSLTGLVILALTALAIASRYVSIFFFDFFVMLISFTATYEVLKLEIKKENFEQPIKNRSYIYLSLAYCYVCYMCYSLAKTVLYAVIYQLISFVVIFIIAFITDLIKLAKLRKAGLEVPHGELISSTLKTLKIMLYPVTLISTLYGFGIAGMGKDFGTMMVILVFAVTMLTDVLAYVVGMTFHKGVLASQISPKKSISGSIGGLLGGLIGAAAVFCVCEFLLKANPFDVYPLWKQLTFFSVVGFIGSICTQLGDLVASYIKRGAGIKDFGNIFPGHGGMMDRIDGLMLTSTLTFLSMIVIFLI